MQSTALYSIFGHAITAGELLIASAVLLALSFILLVFNHRQRIALRRSVVTDELMVHLSRIGDLLEQVAARPMQTLISEPPRRAAESAPPPLAEPAHSMPYSMLGR